MRLIDANALKKDLSEFNYDMALRIVDTQPTIEAEPVRHGRWIVHTTWHGMFGLINSECSECKFDRNGDLSSWQFCPHCGAKMDGGVDNNHAHWIGTEIEGYTGSQPVYSTVACSHCGFENDHEPAYCEQCGYRMDEVIS